MAKTKRKRPRGAISAVEAQRLHDAMHTQAKRSMRAAAEVYVEWLTADHHVSRSAAYRLAITAGVATLRVLEGALTHASLMEEARDVTERRARQRARKRSRRD